MKGVVINYFEGKGYGFIKDENEDNRFFHISEVKQRKQFLENLVRYWCSEYKEECLSITFEPSANSRGLTALNINLTNQILNDMSMSGLFKSIITNVEYDESELTRIVSGVKGGGAPPGATTGGHGTYRIGYPEVHRELNISYRRIDDIGWGKIDVRDLVLKINGRAKVTKRLVKELQDKLIGQKVDIGSTGNQWFLSDTSILML